MTPLGKMAPARSKSARERGNSSREPARGNQLPQRLGAIIETRIAGRRDVDTGGRNDEPIAFGAANAGIMVEADSSVRRRSDLCPARPGDERAQALSRCAFAVRHGANTRMRQRKAAGAHPDHGGHRQQGQIGRRSRRARRGHADRHGCSENGNTHHSTPSSYSLDSVRRWPSRQPRRSARYCNRRAGSQGRRRNNRACG